MLWQLGAVAYIGSRCNKWLITLKTCKVGEIAEKVADRELRSFLHTVLKFQVDCACF